MRSEFAICQVPTASPGIAVQSAYVVHADLSYDVVRPALPPGRTEVFRTVSGAGIVDIGGDSHPQQADDAILLADTGFRYRCTGDQWHFLWFAFDGPGLLPLPICKTMRLAGSASEQEQAYLILDLLRSPHREDAALAAALVSAQILTWARARRRAHTALRPHEATVQRAMAEVRRDPARQWRVREMAAAAGLGERRFRTVFREVARCSPKAFLSRTRLEAAAHLLQTSSLTVSEAAYRLGYSSPFHLSRAFRAAFGQSPSAYARSEPQ